MMRAFGLGAAATFTIITAAALAGCAEGAPPVTAAPIATATVATPAPDDRCSNRINYAGDTRSNAEINSVGEQTGSCPLPIT